MSLLSEMTGLAYDKVFTLLTKRYKFVIKNNGSDV